LNDGIKKQISIYKICQRKKKTSIKFDKKKIPYRGWDLRKTFKKLIQIKKIKIKRMRIKFKILKKIKGDDIEKSVILYIVLANYFKYWRIELKKKNQFKELSIKA